MSRSNLVQVKKNKTMQWFHQPPRDQQSTIIDLAIKRREEVAKLYKKEVTRISKQRREKMVREKCCREALNERATQEGEKLSTLHLITSPTELKSTLSEIDDEAISAKKKAEKKRAVIREQINIRKKVLKQSVKVPFTQKGRQRPLRDIIKELSDFIVENSDIHSPDSLVGKKILHKFKVEGEEKWYSGYVVSYNTRTHLHEVLYDEEDNYCIIFIQLYVYIVFRMSECIYDFCSQ